MSAGAHIAGNMFKQDVAIKIQSPHIWVLSRFTIENSKLKVTIKIQFARLWDSLNADLSPQGKHLCGGGVGVCFFER